MSQGYAMHVLSPHSGVLTLSAVTVMEMLLALASSLKPDFLEQTAEYFREEKEMS